MKGVHFPFLIVLAMSIQFARGAEAPALIERPQAEAGATRVSVGIWMVDITNIDSAQQNFTAEVALVLRWWDPRLTHTGKGILRYPLEQVWHPRIAVVNETNSVSRKFPEVVEVEPDGTVNYRQRYAGAFTQPLRLQSFPFDRQTFRVQLVAVRYRPNEVMFVPDQDWIRNGLRQAGGVAPLITLPDWTLEKWETKPLTYALAPGFEYSSYAFEFTVSRNAQHYIWKVILPLILIVAMSWSVFWVAATEVGPQLSVATTSMLTLIAYRFAIENQLPVLPYTTSLDTFILMSTLLVFFSFIEVLATTILEGRHRNKQAKRIDRFCRVIFPLIFVIASIAIFSRPRS
jgi:neurotransmitter-gated ion-channel